MQHAYLRGNLLFRASRVLPGQHVSLATSPCSLTCAARNPWQRPLHMKSESCARVLASHSQGHLKSSRNMSSEPSKHMEGIGVNIEKLCPPFVDHCFRGMGQVVFCNSPVSGALIAGALFYGDPYLGALAVLGCASATATAKVAGFDSGAISAGLMGYNGALVGCAFPVFLGAYVGPTVLATVVVGGVSAGIASKLGAMTSPVPQWTLAFNITTLAALAYVRPFADAAPASAALMASDLALSDMFSAALVGVSQIFIVNNPIAGAIILGGIAVYSPLAALATFLGSVIGVLTGLAMDADGNQIKDGLWGFNPALTALSVSIFFVPVGWTFFALAGGGACLTALATVVFKELVGGAIESPSLTLPFCAIATGCFLLGGRVPGLMRAGAPHSPELNLAAFRSVA